MNPSLPPEVIQTEEGAGLSRASFCIAIERWFSFFIDEGRSFGDNILCGTGFAVIPYLNEAVTKF
jgi:hypothetical protein